MTAIDPELRTAPQETKLARDESRLSTVAYWLERYRNADFATPAEVKKKYQQMVSKLETSDARVVAEAWFANKAVPKSNRFGEVAPRIREWASRINRD